MLKVVTVHSHCCSIHVYSTFMFRTSKDAPGLLQQPNRWSSCAAIVKKTSSNLAPLLCASCCDEWKGWEPIPGKSGWNHINRDAPCNVMKGQRQSWDSFLSLTIISSSFPSVSRLFVSPGVSSIDSVGWTWIHSHHHRFSASLQQRPNWSFIAEITVWPKPNVASILEMCSLNLPLICAWFSSFLLCWKKVVCLKPSSSAIPPSPLPPHPSPPLPPNLRTNTHTELADT